MNVPKETFACPAHKVTLDAQYFCPTCDKNYPSVNGIPVLLNEPNSLFRTADYLDADHAYQGASGYAGNVDKRSGLRQLYRRTMHRLSESGPPKLDYCAANAIELIRNANPAAKILVIGAGDSTLGRDATYTDVAFGKNVSCIADAHDLPFPDHHFDACIANAVLEHVIDPYRCVDEIMRVLRPGGYVYAETPFMQPVHMREYDFTRFTFLGHRRLFRYFDEIRSGIVGGPGISAGQLLRYAIAAGSDKPGTRKWLKLFGLLFTYPFRYIDLLCISNKSAYDSASGFYFFGTLRKDAIPDRELLGMFRGA